MLKTITAGIAAALLLAAPALAESTARATGTLEIHTGPGLRYAVVGQLPKNVAVRLTDCTREQTWCRISAEGVPDGWVRGSYLVGSAAKNAVTPFKPLVELDFTPFDNMLR